MILPRIVSPCITLCSVLFLLPVLFGDPAYLLERLNVIEASIGEGEGKDSFVNETLPGVYSFEDHKLTEVVLVLETGPSVRTQNRRQLDSHYVQMVLSFIAAEASLQRLLLVDGAGNEIARVEGALVDLSSAGRLRVMKSLRERMSHHSERAASPLKGIDAGRRFLRGSSEDCGIFCFGTTFPTPHAIFSDWWQASAKEENSLYPRIHFIDIDLFEVPEVSVVSSAPASPLDELGHGLRRELYGRFLAEETGGRFVKLRWSPLRKDPVALAVGRLCFDWRGETMVFDAEEDIVDGLVEQFASLSGARLPEFQDSTKVASPEAIRLSVRRLPAVCWVTFKWERKSGAGDRLKQKRRATLYRGGDEWWLHDWE